MSELMTIPEVQLELHCSRSTVYNLLHTNEIESVKIGRFRRVTRKSFNALLERKFQEANCER